MKHTVFKLFVACVLVLCLSLSLGILFTGPSEAGANERLSAAPQLTDKEGNVNFNILSDTAAWVNDHFFFRQELISLNNWLTAKLTGTAVADNVLLGSNGWLYYGSTVADFTGTDRLTDRELYSIAKNISLMQEACEAQGKRFVFTVAPNKNSLYPDNMPDYGTVAQVRDAQRLELLLAQMGVDYADLFSALGEAEETLYFAHDSHWNSQGAALGADVINEALGRQSGYFADAFARCQSHAGDLYEMLYPALTDPETNPVYGGTLRFTYESKATKPDSITLLTAGGGEGALLMYRDSFGNLLYPFLADSFATCRFSRATAYDLTWEADFGVVETVERNLRYLIENQSIYPAPERYILLPETSGKIELAPFDGKAPEGMIQVKGSLPEMPDTESPVYVVCHDRAYEASLQGENEFGAYLPYGAEVTGIAYYAGGELCLLEKQITK